MGSPGRSRQNSAPRAPAVVSAALLPNLTRSRKQTARHNGGQTRFQPRRRGFRQPSTVDHRGWPARRQLFVPAEVIVVAHWPIAWEIFPGNTADCAALRTIVAVLRERFQVRGVTVVADRGMIGEDTIGLLTQDPDAPFDYILGCRMRKQREVSEDVLARAGRYQKVADNLEVKDVVVNGRRYVVCRNPQEAEKDRLAREAILAKFEQALAHGPKSVIGNRGFARFVKIRRNSVSIDARAVEDDARLDGKFVLTTNTLLPTDQVALAYKSLWRVERTFREEKSTLEVRPIFRQLDSTSIGHIVGCFLALRLEVDLQIRLDERQIVTSWPDLMRDLARVQAVVLDLDGQCYRLRTDLPGTSHEAFAAAGVRPPPLAVANGEAAPSEPTGTPEM